MADPVEPEGRGTEVEPTGLVLKVPAESRLLSSRSSLSPVFRPELGFDCGDRDRLGLMVRDPQWRGDYDCQPVVFNGVHQAVLPPRARFRQRLHRINPNQPPLFSWPALKQHADSYLRIRDFRRKFRAVLRQVQCRYKAATVSTLTVTACACSTARYLNRSTERGPLATPLPKISGSWVNSAW